MKRSIISGLILSSLLLSSVTAFAVDRRITASNHSVKHASRGVYAEGYTTSSTRHYTNVKVRCVNTGQEKLSGRNWGRGKVSAKTGYLTDRDDYRYGSNVYYGF